MHGMKIQKGGVYRPFFVGRNLDGPIAKKASPMLPTHRRRAPGRWCAASRDEDTKIMWGFALPLCRAGAEKQPDF